MLDLKFYIASLVQGVLGSNSTFHLFLLSLGQIMGKCGHLVIVRGVEPLNQSVHRVGCDKTNGEDATFGRLRALINICFSNNDN